MTSDEACSRRISCSSRMVCCTACSAAAPNFSIAAFKRRGIEFKADRHGAHRRHDLRLSDKYHRPRGIRRSRPAVTGVKRRIVPTLRSVKVSSR